jgi:hypothetical protein
MYWKRLLSGLREMAAIGIGNTTNRVVFEITPAGVFNFWKNFGDDLDVTFRWGDGLVAGYHEAAVPITLRNHVLVAGQNPADSLLREEVTDTTSITNIGRRMEPVFFSWARDSTELSRAASFRGSMSMRDIVDLSINFHPNKLVPPYPGGSMEVGDRVQVSIDNGVTLIEDQYLIEGAQTYWIRGQERVNLMLSQEAGVA